MRLLTLATKELVILSKAKKKQKQKKNVGDMMVFLPFIEHKTVTNFISTEQKILLP